jgi:sugar porter (SP) family MFS transporter
MGFVYLVAIVAACAGLLFGYDTGAVSGAIVFVRQEFRLTPLMVGVVTSIALAGASAGAAAGGSVADRFGRRHVIIGTAVLFILGSIGSAFSPSVDWLIASRVVIGIATGVASFVAPMYLSEMAPPKVRGSMVACNQLAVTIGILASYLVDYGFADGRRWRWMFGVGVVPALALLIGMTVVPDTPRWLMLRGRKDEALAALRRIRTPAQIGPELGEMREALAASSGRWSDLLSSALRMPMIVGIGLAVLQQATGINTVIYFAPTIFHQAGFASGAASIFASLSVGVVNVVMTVVAVLLLDRVGRRPLLLIGEAGMVLGLAALAAGFALRGAGGLVGWITTFSLIAYVGFFAIGLGPVFWLLIAEIYPLRLRGRAMSVATVANWVANLIMTLTFPALVAAIGSSATFGLYALIGVASFIFTWRLVPETRGKTLEQIEQVWGTSASH